MAGCSGPGIPATHVIRVCDRRRRWAYLGGCGLNQIDHANGRANLGYWVRSSAVGRGVATAAVQLVRQWGFEQTSLLRLEVVIAVGNLASHRVAEKAGAISGRYPPKPAAAARQASRCHDVLVHSDSLAAFLVPTNQRGTERNEFGFSVSPRLRGP